MSSHVKRPSSYAIAVLDERMIVTADSHQEEHDIDVLKDMDPLLALGTLPTHVEHTVGELTRLKDGFGDACCP